jgi:uncharacterized protein
VTTVQKFQPRFLRSIADIDASVWNALAGESYPFLRHEFLWALESSGCTTAETGWTPCHLLLETTVEGKPEIVACLPLYLRNNSWGEYVFDWSWADAYARHGLDYYPKLLSAIPYTPCAGPRLCLLPGIDTACAVATVLAVVEALASKQQASSWHLLFPDVQQKALFDSSSLLQRTGCQYQWFNRNYQNFEDFLAAMNSRKRKNIRKERLQVQQQGIMFRLIEGAAITNAEWELFTDFYKNTYHVRGRKPYLNAAFFRQLGNTMPESLMLALAYHNEVCVAGALFFKGSDTLFGRYWGCSTEFQFLHFETCYYQGIDYCIRNGLHRFDSGAQGEHKIQRGFEPVPTWSLHWIAHPQFRTAIAQFVREEAEHIAQYRDHAAGLLPFRKEVQA